jgi:hypothetical protein
MDHELATKNQSVDRYFLGEMEPPEREAFEEHFFVCDLCADDVRATSAFVDNAKAILQERKAWTKGGARGWMGRWLGWFRPAFATGALAALCLVVIGYQNFSVIPGLRAPRSMQAIALDGATRSAGPKLHESQPLYFQMPSDGISGGSVFVELRSGSRTVSSLTVDDPHGRDPLGVFFPSRVKPGRYSVVVRAYDNGRPGRELLQSEFEVIP